MCTFLFPGHYVETAVPILDGKPLMSAGNPREYRFYLDWLAKHLLDVPPDEATHAPETTAEAVGEAAALAYKAWYHYLYCVQPFETYLEEGVDYDAVYRKMKEWHQETYADETDPDCIEDLDADWINPEIWQNAKREYAEKQRFQGQHCDMGYRRQLAAIIAVATTHADRVSILDAFFKSYTEEALK